MATSENLGLYLPTRDDYISVKRDISDNMEIIDAAVGQNIADINKVGTATVIEATSIETLKTNLLNAVNSIEISDMIAVRIAPSFSSNGFTSGSTYGGYAFNIYKSGGTTSYFSCVLSNNIGEDMIIGYNNGNWFFKPVSNAIQSADTVVQNITGVKNALMNFANQMAVGESKLVRIVHVDNGDTSIMRPSVRYAGYLTKNYTNCFSWLASGYLEKEPVIFSYFSDSQYWVADKLALNSEFKRIAHIGVYSGTGVVAGGYIDVSFPNLSIVGYSIMSVSKFESSNENAMFVGYPLSNTDTSATVRFVNVGGSLQYLGTVYVDLLFAKS